MFLIELKYLDLIKQNKSIQRRDEIIKIQIKIVLSLLTLNIKLI